MNEFANPSFDYPVEDDMPRLRRGGMQYPRKGYKMVPVEPPVLRQIDIQVYGEYQLFGDVETDDWEKSVFADNTRADVIKAHTLLYVTTGAWGVRFVTFMVDFEVPVGTQEQIKSSANKKLRELFKEDDFELRYITML